MKWVVMKVRRPMTMRKDNVQTRKRRTNASAAVKPSAASAARTPDKLKGLLSFECVIAYMYYYKAAAKTAC